MRQVSPGWHKELYWVLPESGSGHFNSNQLRRNHHSLKSGVSPTHLPGNLIVSLGFFSTPKLLWHNFSCYLQSKYTKLFSSAGKSSEWWESALCGLWSTLRHSAVADSLCVSRSLTWSSWTLNSVFFSWPLYFAVESDVMIQILIAFCLASWGLRSLTLSSHYHLVRFHAPWHS